MSFLELVGVWGETRGEGATRGVRRIHSVVAAIAVASALILFGNTAHAECSRGAACNAKWGDVRARPSGWAPKPEPERERDMRSPAMFGGGLALTALGVLTLSLGSVYAIDYLGCAGTESHQYFGGQCAGGAKASALLITGVAELAVGIPLAIVGGSHRLIARPAAGFSPWVTREGAGLNLRLEM